MSFYRWGADNFKAIYGWLMVNLLYTGTKTCSQQGHTLTLVLGLPQQPRQLHAGSVIPTVNRIHNGNYLFKHQNRFRRVYSLRFQPKEYYSSMFQITEGFLDKPL